MLDLWELLPQRGNQGLGRQEARRTVLTSDLGPGRWGEPEILDSGQASQWRGRSAPSRARATCPVSVLGSDGEGDRGLPGRADGLLGAALADVVVGDPQA